MTFSILFRTLFGLLFISMLALPAIAADPPKAASTSSADSSKTAGSPVENAVVKVFSTVRNPDLSRPWTKQAPGELTGSGVVIEGKRILTNAHVVLYASQVQVQANQEGDKISATVVAIAPGIDLAVLKLDDESFFDTHPPVQRASKLPEIKDPVLAYGFPTGGTSLSITKGIVSRIEFTQYNYPVLGLRIQIDAAINPGNSGGPAISGDKMIGLAFSTLSDSQNIGYIIPNEEIELFLADIADGHYDGKPAMYDDLQTLENPALRGFLKLDRSVDGMVVHRPRELDPAYPLKEWDVITKIADSPVDNQGMIRIGRELRVNFRYLIQKVAHDGKVPLTVVRAGKHLQIELPVSTEKPTLISDLKGEYPSYFIYGPLVFSRATYQYVALFTRNTTTFNAMAFRASPIITRLFDAPDAERDELVVVSSPFFPHRLAKGYDNPIASVVNSINGIKVRSLHHLVEILRDLKDPFVVVDFDQRGGEDLVFSRKEMLDATEDILTDNGVRAQGSVDMLEVWRAKPAK